MQQTSVLGWLTAMTIALKSFTITAAPTRSCIADPSCGPIPGESDLYSTYTGVEAPWPANVTGATLNTTAGDPGEDDLLFQNLLSAEWIIFSFYQQGVETFNESAFVSAGFINTTYSRIREIRNNEAGHIRIFQDQISSNSVKPGPCQYKFPFTDATSYLALQTIIEVSSMTFLTGLELQATLPVSKSALVAVAATESRHNTWSLIDNWGANPFAGPVDTVFPYANQILGTTRAFVVNGSCPTENPVYPSPRQALPAIELAENTTSIAPGANITLKVSGGETPLQFQAGQDYFAVFFHGVLNVSVPFNPADMTTVIPPELEARGIYELVLAAEAGAPTEDSVVAGPYVFLELPDKLQLQG